MMNNFKERTLNFSSGSHHDLIPISNQVPTENFKQINLYSRKEVSTLKTYLSDLEMTPNSSLLAVMLLVLYTNAVGAITPQSSQAYCAGCVAIIQSVSMCSTRDLPIPWKLSKLMSVNFASELPHP